MECVHVFSQCIHSFPVFSGWFQVLDDPSEDHLYMGTELTHTQSNVQFESLPGIVNNLVCLVPQCSSWSHKGKTTVME